MRRLGPKAPTATHDPLLLKFLLLEKANVVADCLENQFTPHDPCDKNHKWWQVEARVKALLEAVDNNNPERVQPCDVQKLTNSMTLRKACTNDNIPNECIRNLPTKPMVHLTHLFNIAFGCCTSHYLGGKQK